MLSFNYTDTFGERRPMNSRFLEGRAQKRKNNRDGGGDGSDRPFKRGKVSKFAKVKEKARLMKKMKQNKGTFEDVRAQKRERKEERRASRPRPDGGFGGGESGFKRGDGGNRFAGNGNRDYQPKKVFNSNKGSRPGKKKVVARKGRASFRTGNA